MPRRPAAPSLIKKIERHDRSQFEVKLDYPLDPLAGTQEYLVEAFFFLPANLGVDQHTYASSEFYRDVSDHLRFRTPRMSLEQLLDGTNTRSPLTRLSDFRRDLSAGSHDDILEQRVVYEARMLSNILRVAIQDELARVDALSDQAEAKRAGEALLRGIRQVVDAYRRLEPAFAAAARDPDVVGQFRLVDENLSLIAEGFALGRPAEDAHTSDEGRALALREVAYREERGYLTLVDPGGSNELYAYRRSLLKKYVNSVLYLNLEQKDAVHGAESIAFAIAAGAAMAFATAVTFIAATLAPLSWSLFAVLVVSYIAKDRIKEWFKSVFRRFADRRMDDHVVSIHDPASGEAIGRFRQKFRFLAVRDVPDEVRQVRAIGRTEFLAEREFAEHVFAYRKRIALTPGKVFGHHRRVDALTDILRFNVQRFVRRMDDPDETLRYPDPETGACREARAQRTYHVNVVLRYCVGTAPEPSFRKIRVVMTSKGISRVEEVPLAAVAEPLPPPPRRTRPPRPNRLSMVQESPS